MAKRYADFVLATELQKDGGDYPAITRIGFLNKYRSRLHLVLLMALDHTAPASVVNALAGAIESFFFFSNTLGVQAKVNELLFAQWAKNLRGVKDEAGVTNAVDTTIWPLASSLEPEFKDRFLNVRHSAYDPGYRLRFVLGRMENTLLAQAGLPQVGTEMINEMQVEHILPQTPSGWAIPETLALTKGDYESLVQRLGNVTLLEAKINQAVNNFNDLNGDWFEKKQSEYGNSALLTPKMFDPKFAVGKNTEVNNVKAKLGFTYAQWDAAAILHRQKMLLELAMETWKINGKRLDYVPNVDAVTSA